MPLELVLSKGLFSRVNSLLLCILALLLDLILLCCLGAWLLWLYVVVVDVVVVYYVRHEWLTSLGTELGSVSLLLLYLTCSELVAG